MALIIFLFGLLVVLPGTILAFKSNITNDYEIILASDIYTMIVGDKVEVLYTIVPADTNAVLSWDVVDEYVANINNGVICANNAGETKIIASIGASTATSKVIVYERLSVDEQKFVEAMLTVLHEFRNPETVSVNAVRARSDGSGWDIEVTAQNGFGGNSIESYYIYKNYIRRKSNNDVIHDKSLNLENINRAIKNHYNT